MSKDKVLEQIERVQRLEQAGQVDEAVRVVKHLWQLQKGHPKIMDAVLVWARAEQTNPDAIFALSSCHMYKGDFEKAVEGMRLVERFQPNNAEVKATLAVCYKAIGDLLLSADYTVDALTLDPQNSYALTNCVDVLYDQGHFQKALDVALAAVQEFPNEAGLHSNIARLYCKLDQAEKAYDYHLFAIKSKPENAGLRANFVGYLLSCPDREKEFLAELSNAYKLFMSKSAARHMHAQQWLHLQYLHAIMKDQIVHAGDLILKAEDMEKLDETHEGTMRLLTKEQPVWLFSTHNVKCYTTDWGFFDETRAYLNWKVTGSNLLFLMAYGMDGRVYVCPTFPEAPAPAKGVLIGSVPNYYHWIVDYLPRLAVFDLYPELKDLPIYLNTDYAGFQDEALQLLGIDPARIQRLPVRHITHLNDVYVPLIPGRPSKESGEPDWMKPNENPFIVQWLREKFLPHIKNKEPTKRYFISRAGASFRRCVNEDKIFAIAQEYGFEKMQNEGKTFAEQLDMYGCADAIIGPHGAGFTNMIFSPSTAKIFEFFPFNRSLRYYQAIAEQIGQPYFTLEGPIVRVFPDKSPDFGDFTLDEDAFRATMEQHFR